MLSKATGAEMVLSRKGQGVARLKFGCLLQDLTKM